MFFVREASVIDTIRRFAIVLNADFIEGQGEARLELDNDFGKGSIRAIQLASGLGCFLYNVFFHKDFLYFKDETLMSPLYFIYCLHGELYHSFGKEKTTTRILPLHNYIIHSKEDNSNVGRFVANQQVMCTSITLDQRALLEENALGSSYLKDKLLEVFETINPGNNYRHMGKMMLAQADLVRDIFANDATGIVGRLYMESSILNLLSQQIGAHQTAKSDVTYNSPIRKKETQTVLEIGDFIAKHISDDVTITRLQDEFGLSPAKLQSGFKHVFGKSVHTFITDTRMEHARHLIENTDLSISEIAYSIGLNSRSNFSKLFYKRFGHLPSDYQEVIESANACYELTYKSRASAHITNSEIKKIYDIAGARNVEMDVTGCLLYYDEEFFQILEGPKSNVLDIMSSIEKDDRHYDIEIIWEGIKPIRTFTSWQMVNLDNKEYNFAKNSMPVKKLEQELKARVKEENSRITNRFWSNIRNFLLTYDN